MTHPSYVLLYVQSPAASAAFYSQLLARNPVESSETFALFVLDGGFKLGLWGRDGVIPKATLMGGGAELCFALADDGEVDAWHARWSAQGMPVLQLPERMDFGYTFVATDPDGHRLRVFAPCQP